MPKKHTHRPNKKNNRLKTFLPLIVIISVFLILINIPKSEKNSSAVSPVSKPMVSPASEWKKYQNDKAKFEFQYPSDWVLSTVSEKDDLLSLNLKIDDVSQIYEINVTVEKNPNNLSAESFLNEANIKSEKITIAGLEGVKYSEEMSRSSGPATAIVFSNDSWIYRFVYSAMATKETHQKYFFTFNQLLSTVKFLD